MAGAGLHLQRGGVVVREARRGARCVSFAEPNS